jgi:hypothetical protein
MALLSFTGGAGSPFGITLHTPLQFEVTAPFPSTGDSFDGAYGIAFLNVGDMIDTRGISTNIQITVNGSPTLYNELNAGLMAAGQAPMAWGIGSFSNNLVVYNQFMQFTQLVAPADLEGVIPGISAHLAGFPLTTGSKFEWSAGTMTTNSSITLNSSIAADGYYEVVVIDRFGSFAPVSVTLASVPEPSTGLLAITFASAMAMRRRRQRPA